MVTNFNRSTSTYAPEFTVYAHNFKAILFYSVTVHKLHSNQVFLRKFLKKGKERNLGLNTRRESSIHTHTSTQPIHTQASWLVCLHHYTHVSKVRTHIHKYTQTAVTLNAT